MKDIHGGDIWGASRQAARPLENIIDFSASINPLGLPPGSCRSIKMALKHASMYPDPASAELIRSLSEFHGISQREILAGNGSTEFIYLIPGVFKPSRALIVEPAFSEYRRALELSGCEADSLILREDDGWALDIKRLRRRLGKGYDIVYLANPANPTGALIKKEPLIETMEVCGNLGIVLVIDEAFADFNEDESVKKEALRRKNTVVLRSMTKFFSMAGLRLGFITAHRETVGKLSRHMPPWSVNTLASAAAVSALADSGYMERTRRWLAKERGFLLEGLRALKRLHPYPSSANFLMVKITSGPSASELKDAMFKAGILIRDLSAFRGLGPRYFRVAVRTRDENMALLERLKEVLETG